MENKSPFSDLFESIGETLSEQQWFQTLRGKWEELDPQNRVYLKFGALGATAVVALLLVTTATVKVNKVRKEFTAKSELLTLISSANDELRQLRDANRGVTTASATSPWAEYFQVSASNAGVDPAKLSVSAEKPGKSPSVPTGHDKQAVTVKESLFEISMKRINVRQLVRYAHQLENGPRPVKIRHLGIDAEEDLSGYLNATVAVSAFSVASN